MKFMQYDPVTIARLFLFVREAAQNAGQRVEAIQKWCGGEKGLSWCCYFVTMVLDICFQGHSPIPRTGSCQEVYDICQKNGWLTDTPNVGDLFFYINAGHVHHIGIVTWTSASSPSAQRRGTADAGKTVGIAGNTSEDGKSSNGTGVFEHSVNATVFAHYPRA